MNKIIEQFNLLALPEQIYLLNIILEGIKSARELYLDSGKINKEDFDRLLELDPSETNKYLNWMCKQYIKGIDIEGLGNCIFEFDNKIRKGLIKHTDINYYKDIDELDSVLFITPDKSKSEEEKYIKKTQSNIILDNDKYFIVEPLNWEASKIYGKGTQWCTSAEDTDAHWYSDVGDIRARIFYIRDKKLNINNTEYKIAIYVPLHRVGKNEKIDYSNISCTLWDAEDNPTESNLKKVSNRFGIDIDKISNITYMDKEEIKYWLDTLYIEDYTINDDLTVDVDSSVWLGDKNLSKIPIQFGIVKGSFYCYKNELQTLKGSPKEVKGDFSCSKNHLTSLEYSPKIVGGNFYCSFNNLTKKYLSNFDFSFVEGELSTDYDDIDDKWNKY